MSTSQSGVTIKINNRQVVNLREVEVIERFNEESRVRMSERYDAPSEQFEVFQSQIRFIDGRKPLLVVQDFDELAKRARGRMIVVQAQPDGEDGALIPTKIVPIDAIRHLEHVNKEDRAAIGAAYADVDPETLANKKTRIVYRETRPGSGEASNANYAQKLYEVGIKEDLRAIQGLNVVALGNGKFVLGSEIADAKALSEAEIARLSRTYATAAKNGDALITTVTLKGDGSDLILSTFKEGKIAEAVGRDLPSAKVPARRGRTQPQVVDPDEPANDGGMA